MSALAGVPHTAIVASLTAPTVSRPRRSAAVTLAVMASLVLVWLTVLLTRHDDGRLGTGIVHYLVPVTFLVAAQVHFLRLYRRRRPVAFEVRDGAFVAPAADALTAAMAGTVLSGFAMAASFFLAPLSSTRTPLDAVGRVCVPMLLACFLLQVAVLARGTGRIQVRPEGLRITYAYGTRDVPWDAVAGGPPRTGGLKEPMLRIGRPDLIRSTGLARRRPAKVLLPASSAWVRREFLADAINHYLAAPAARERIGTAEEYQDLRRVLRAG